MVNPEKSRCPNSLRPIIGRLFLFIAGIVSTLTVHAENLQPENLFNINKLQVGTGENALLATDINGDELIDLVVATENLNTIAVRLGNGSGELSTPQTYAAGENPTAIASADFNSDGTNDLVIANHERPYVTVLFGDGNGRFDRQLLQIELTVAPHPHKVSAIDINRDNGIDIVVDSRDQLGIFILDGNGLGNFDSPGIGVDVQGAPYLGFAIGDLNGDTLPDLVTPNADDISILLNASKPELNFAFAQSLTIDNVFAVELADFNNDGHLDLIAATESAINNVQIYLGTAKGTLAASPIATLSIAAGAKTLDIGDFNGDGRIEAVICAWAGDIVIVQLEEQKATAYKLPLEDIQAPWGLTVGDLYRDGRDDIIVSDGESTAANIYLSTDHQR